MYLWLCLAISIDLAPTHTTFPVLYTRKVQCGFFILMEITRNVYRSSLSVSKKHSSRKISKTFLKLRFDSNANEATTFRTVILGCIRLHHSARTIGDYGGALLAKSS